MCQPWLSPGMYFPYMSVTCFNEYSAHLCLRAQLRFVTQRKRLSTPGLVGKWTGLEHVRQTGGGCYSTDLSVLPPPSSIWWRQLACCPWLCRWAPSRSPRWPHPRGSRWLGCLVGLNRSNDGQKDTSMATFIHKHLIIAQINTSP